MADSLVENNQVAVFYVTEVVREGPDMSRGYLEEFLVTNSLVGDHDVVVVDVVECFREGLT